MIAERFFVQHVVFDFPGFSIHHELGDRIFRFKVRLKTGQRHCYLFHIPEIGAGSRPAHFHNQSDFSLAESAGHIIGFDLICSPPATPVPG